MLKIPANNFNSNITIPNHSSIIPHQIPSLGLFFERKLKYINNQSCRTIDLISAMNEISLLLPNFQRKISKKLKQQS